MQNKYEIYLFIHLLVIYAERFQIHCYYFVLELWQHFMSNDSFITFMKSVVSLHCVVSSNPLSAGYFSEVHRVFDNKWQHIQPAVADHIYLIQFHLVCLLDHIFFIFIAVIIFRTEESDIKLLSFRQNPEWKNLCRMNLIKCDTSANINTSISRTVIRFFKGSFPQDESQILSTFSGTEP